jgi:DNA-binding transcriptional ArsR family regulator
MKRRAARHAADGLEGRVAPDSQGLTPSWSPPVQEAPAPLQPPPEPTEAPAPVQPPPAPASVAPTPTPRGATKAAVLAALSTDRGLTAGEVAAVTGLARSTVSSTLSKLAKSGEVDKADRGYRLPG